MIEVTLPQLSLSMEEGKIARWLVGDGATVTQGQPILEIETDKAIAEVEAPAAGLLHRKVEEGTLVPVNSVLGEIAEVAAPVATAAVASTLQARAALAAKAEHPTSAASTAAEHPRPRTNTAMKHRASPAARRIASERGIDLARLGGSGPGGRIIVSDLASAPQPARHAAGGLRAAVVAHLQASWRDIPHIHIGGELDGEGIAAAKRSAASGITVTDLLVFVVARALRAVPELNGEVGKAASHIHLALAVATPNGVMAPVLRDVGALSLSEIGRERNRLVSAARAGSIDRRDLAGGTFTLTNLGAYPVDFFAPIVSGPQVAALACGRLAQRPAAENGVVTVRNRIWMNVAIDHRGADGVSGARLLGALQESMNALET